jgi:menaquinone-dependent protoporphyrinogen oxidase
MKVLVTAASRYGATYGIAEAIREELGEAGHVVTVVPAEEAPEVEGHDAVVVGSGVYAGHWLEPAKEFVTAHAPQLRERPVWLFSSGPLGDPPEPEEDAVDADELTEQCGAVEHRTFAGRLDRSRLHFGDKAIALALRAPEGDFRDWDEIRAWARDLARALDRDGPGEA